MRINTECLLTVLQSHLMEEAARCLALSEAGSRKAKSSSRASARFPAGLEWELLNADAVVLLGLTHALRYVKQPLVLWVHLCASFLQRVVYGLRPVHVCSIS